ncbi:hypothetical protein IMSAGC019_01647 [Lachnospiraceae bacterium]|nr:hypothetical protein IMSAGC019_01647 [Lachnospiraceae bacterium]
MGKSTAMRESMGMKTDMTMMAMERRSMMRTARAKRGE